MTDGGGMDRVCPSALMTERDQDVVLGLIIRMEELPGVPRDGVRTLSVRRLGVEPNGRPYGIFSLSGLNPATGDVATRLVKRSVCATCPHRMKCKGLD